MKEFNPEVKKFIQEWIDFNKKVILNGKEFIKDQQQEIEKAEKRIKILEELL